MNGSTGDKGAFFVGYLKMPKSLALFYWVLVPILVGLAVGVSAAFLSSQADPGKGRFVPGYKVLTGKLQVEPYPVLFLPPSDDYPKGRALALTGPGKIGALRWAKKHDGALVDVGGVFITRGAHSVFQVGGKVRIRPTEAEVTADLTDLTIPAREDLGQHTLSGEIVDSKCYLGAMRPGTGKVHMACANYCLLGDIPPMLVTYHSEAGPDGDISMFLIATPDGDMVSPELFDYTSLAVEVEGTVIRQGSLLMLLLDPDDVTVL